MKREAHLLHLAIALVFLLSLALAGPATLGRAMQAPTETPSAGQTTAPAETATGEAPVQAEPSNTPTVNTTAPSAITTATEAATVAAEGETATALPLASPTPAPAETAFQAGELVTALAALDPNDWPQVQKNAQHTGYSAETLGTSLPRLWTHAFQPDKVYPQVQAIVASGKVFVGTESGYLYAFLVSNGAQAWKYAAGGPIMNSVATDGTHVYFGAMDGAVYAVNIDTGALAWRSPVSRRKGFSTAPVLADNQVLIGGRDGNFYSFNPGTGQVNWQYNAGAPILQTAAANNGKVYFTAMDMRATALQTSNGALAWRSGPISGTAFKDYWPVVYNNSVILRPVPTNMDAGIMADFPFLWFDNSTQWNWLTQYGPQVASGKLAQIPDAMNAQTTVLQKYASSPGGFVRSMFILNEATGNEDFVVPHWSGQTMGGGTAPPCVDANGYLVVPVMFARGAWGRLDLNSRRIVDILYDGLDRNGNRVDANHPYAAGMGNPDETVLTTCTRNLVLSIHRDEENAFYTGAFDLAARRWFHISPGETNRQMTTNTQGGGGNPASVSNGKMFHISRDELIVRGQQP